jgi:hypothetical protein
MIHLVMDPREQTRAWVRGVLEHLKITPTELARRADIAQSTLTRFLYQPEHPHDLSRRTIAAIARVAGTEPFTMPAAGPAPSEVVEITDIDDGDTIWRALLKTDRQSNTIQTHIMNSRALELVGYLPGDLLIVDSAAVPARGDVVFAEIGATEFVFRIYEPPFLTAASHDERFRRPIIVDSLNVHIRGVVTGSYRSRGRQKAPGG